MQTVHDSSEWMKTHIYLLKYALKKFAINGFGKQDTIFKNSFDVKKLYLEIKRFAGSPLDKQPFDEFARELIQQFTSAAWDALADDPEQAAFFLHEKNRLGLYDDAGVDNMTL